MTRDDILCALDIDLSLLGLEQRGLAPYFCTPEGAEPVGDTDCDGVHFVLLPGDEHVFCVAPAWGREATRSSVSSRHRSL